VFALLALAVLALATAVLQDEKVRSHRVYAEGVKKNQAQIAARLRHPTGLLALLNPEAADRPAQPVRPLVLPFGALDFDDRAKAQQAVEMAGCALQYSDGATLCAAVGSNPYAGGFVYLVATFNAPVLVAHTRGDLELKGAHRARVEVDYRGQKNRWIAPYEAAAPGSGRLTGYAGDAPVDHGARPVRDFRGWLWQESRCAERGAEDAGCARRSYLSIRLPVEVLRDALAGGRPQWPPPDLDRLALRLQLLSPNDAAPVFDSDRPGATRSFSLDELRALLLPGERLVVTRAGVARPLFELTGTTAQDGVALPWITRLVRRLPAEGWDRPVQARETIATPQGRYELLLTGDTRSVDQALAAVATRLGWTVAAMLLAIALAWAVIEVFVIRRITLLTRRAAAVSAGVKGGEGLAELDLSDLRGSDELGVLAQGLRDLLQRVNEDMRREQIRTRQEKDMWHAVGHEIVAPLQSLLALHGGPADASGRYVRRMQQAVRVLYGEASPSEAFEATSLQLGTVDLDAFLGHVAENAPYIGVTGVHYDRQGQAVPAAADEHSLEDVVTHVLKNAQRHRTPGTPIRIGLALEPQVARVAIHNDGAPIPEPMLERIFEYGVSEAPDAAALGHRGQGLFVARTYMAKMGGTIVAHNTARGVCFELVLPRAVA
jgi:signal transduction histidine kinase